MKKGELITKLSRFFISDRCFLPIDEAGQLDESQLIAAAEEYKALFRDPLKTGKALNEEWMKVGKTHFSPSPEKKTSLNEHTRLQALMLTFAVIESTELDRAKENANKLWRLLGNYKDCQAFLKKYGSSPIEPLSIHNTCLFTLPPAEEQWDKETWAKLVLKQESMLDYLSLAPEIEKRIEEPLDPNNIKKTAEKIRYPRADEHPELAKLCLKFKKSNRVFEECLALMKDVKKSDQLPTITIPGEKLGIEYEGYTFSKLPPGDIRGFFLGEYTHCCQSIDAESESCVISGMTRQNSGFYIITDKKGDIVAESMAWIGTQGQLVFDSFERKDDRYEFLCKPFYKEAARQAKCQGFNHAYLGKGGNTPEKLEFFDPDEAYGIKYGVLYPYSLLNQVMQPVKQPLPEIYTDAGKQFLLAVPTGPDDFQSLIQDCSHLAPQATLPKDHEDPLFKKIYDSPDAWKEYLLKKPKELQEALITRHDDHGHNLFYWAVTTNNVEFLKHMTTIMSHEKLQVLAQQLHLKISEGPKFYHISEISQAEDTATYVSLLEAAVESKSMDALDYLVKEGIVIPNAHFWETLEKNTFPIDKLSSITQYRDIFKAIENKNDADFMKLIEGLPSLSATNAEGESLLEAACKHNFPAAIEKLLSLDISIYELIHSVNNLVTSIVETKNLNLLTILIKRNIMSSLDIIDLADCFKSADLETVRTSVEDGCDPNELLIGAILNEKTDIIEYLTPISDLNTLHGSEELTALQGAIYRENLEAARILLDNGAEVNFPNPSKNTPLLILLSRSHREVENIDLMNLLLKHGAKPDDINDEGKTAVHIAIDSYALKSIPILLQHAPPNFVNRVFSDGKTLLTNAIFSLLSSHLFGFQKDVLNTLQEMIPILVKEGADINITDIYNNSPLHYAAGLSDSMLPPSPEIVKTLLLQGADINGKNKAGKTALDIAKEKRADKRDSYDRDRKNKIDETIQLLTWYPRLQNCKTPAEEALAILNEKQDVTTETSANVSSLSQKTWMEALDEINLKELSDTLDKSENLSKNEVLHEMERTCEILSSPKLKKTLQKKIDFLEKHSINEPSVSLTEETSEEIAPKRE